MDANWYLAPHPFCISSKDTRNKVAMTPYDNDSPPPHADGVDKNLKATCWVLIYVLTGLVAITAILLQWRLLQGQ